MARVSSMCRTRGIDVSVSTFMWITRAWRTALTKVVVGWTGFVRLVRKHQEILSISTVVWLMDGNQIQPFVQLLIGLWNLFLISLDYWKCSVVLIPASFDCKHIIKNERHSYVAPDLILLRAYNLYIRTFFSQRNRQTIAILTLSTPSSNVSRENLNITMSCTKAT